MMPHGAWVVFSIVGAIGVLAVARILRGFRGALPGQPLEQHAVACREPFTLEVTATGEPQLLWLSFAFSAGRLTDHFVKSQVGVWGRLTIDGAPLSLAIGDLAPAELPRVDDELFQPSRGGGQVSASAVLVALRARPAGQTIRIAGQWDAAADPLRLVLWTTRPTVSVTRQEV